MQTAFSPLKTVDVLEDLRRQAQQAQELAHAGAGHPVPAGECRGVLDPRWCQSACRHPRARVRASMIRGRMARSRRGWHAARFRSVCRYFHAAPPGRGSLNQGPSSGRTTEGPRDRRKRRGPPARGRTGRPGCFSLPGRGISVTQPSSTPRGFCGDQVGSLCWPGRRHGRCILQNSLGIATDLWTTEC